MFQEGRSFSWTSWWKYVRTDARLRPPEGLCDAIFTVFHFLGMLGVSEAQAGSVASLLKRYSPAVVSRLGASRIIEKTLLRTSG
eukprot:4895334-Alexandrium_andersonii.AAC.1